MPNIDIRIASATKAAKVEERKPLFSRSLRTRVPNEELAK